MLEIDQILIDGVTYAVKDSTARDSIAALEEYVDGNFLTALYNTIFPVNRVIITEDANFDPNVVYGGTWVRIEDGRAAVAKATSGEASKAIFGSANSILPSHNHVLPSHYHTMGPHSHSGNGWNFSVYKGVRSSETVGGISGSGYSMTQVKSGGSWGGYASIPAANPGDTSIVPATDVSTVGVAVENTNYQPSHTYYFWKRIALATLSN